ncbi:MAG TPA: hypothetical protein EYG18_04110 [Micavibrio sp.]|nr:hypothetical protein [Micavibrio sp.]HIL28434.1 hypothetical protein [Micavibrio sp.]
MTMTDIKIPSYTLICALRVAPSFYKAVQAQVEAQNDPTIVLFQGQAKTYKDGPINPTMFVQDDFDDHPGMPLSDTEKMAIEAKLKDPRYKLRIVNSFAGDNANDRARAGEMVITFADVAYRMEGGISKIAYDLLYDGDGRNDKIHMVEAEDESGVKRLVSEANVPTGKIAPIQYRRNGADTLTVFDPHSKQHRVNLTQAFGESGIRILSSLEEMAQQIVEENREAITEGKFRIGAPDGWDKKDDPEKNEAIIRVQRVCEYIFNNVPEISRQYETAADYAENIMFGIKKVREAPYQGAPAKPVVKQLFGTVKDCCCVLLDDLADSGGSLTQSGTALLKAGAARVNALVCHGPAHEQSLYNILNATVEIDDVERLAINRLTVTNTMPRVETFYANLPEPMQRRTNLLNCAPGYLRGITTPLGPKQQPAPHAKLGPV